MLNPQSRRWSRRPPKRVRLVALDVAQALCHDLDITDAEDVEIVQAAAFHIGSCLAAGGRPGEWDRIDIEDVMTRLPEGDVFDAVLHRIVDLLTWLAGTGVLQRRRCLQYLHDIQHHAAPDEALHERLDESRRFLFRYAP